MLLDAVIAFTILFLLSVAITTVLNVSLRDDEQTD